MTRNSHASEWISPVNGPFLGNPIFDDLAAQYQLAPFPQEAEPEQTALDTAPATEVAGDETLEVAAAAPEAGDDSDTVTEEADTGEAHDPNAASSDAEDKADRIVPGSRFSITFDELLGITRPKPGEAVEANAERLAEVEALTLIKRGEQVRRLDSPYLIGHYSWNQLVAVFGKEERANAREEMAAAIKTAEAKSPEERTASDLFALANEENNTLRRQAETAGDEQLVDRLRTYRSDEFPGALAAQLQSEGQLGPEFANVRELEDMMHLMVYEGLRSSYFYDDQQYVTGVAQLLLEATARIPDFKPVRAGLLDFYDHMCIYNAVLFMEAKNQSAVRGGALGDDEITNTVRASLYRAERAMALAVEQRKIRIVMPGKEGE
ncbi:MAG TPA: hypothetical protein VLF91_01415 [Candidatus Saccharimonadales bacterium]|nr:hypothetical protein [Candidatus Saccharimonadales bacterium]